MRRTRSSSTRRSGRAAATVVAAAVAVLVPGAAYAASFVHEAGPVVRMAAGDATTVPDGAAARVHGVETGDGRTIVTLHVKGLAEDRVYGAHVHAGPCGVGGSTAGPHFQRVQGGLTDPAYANPANEVWLDLRTDETGTGHAKSTVTWQFPDERRPGSVIIHARATDRADGTAGPRLACFPVQS